MIDRTREADTLVAFCHNGSVATCFMNSLFGAFRYDAQQAANGHRQRLAEYHDASGPYIHDNRARIASYFLDHTDYQWLWMLDNDIRFSPDTVHRMFEEIEERDIKLAAAAYWIKYGDQGLYLSWLLFAREGIRALNELPDTTDPVEVTATGMGCTLIHRDVLEDIRRHQREIAPDDPWDTFGSDVLRYEDGKSERMGEDVTFAMRARKHGHIVYGLPTVVVDHFKSSYLPRGRQELSPISPLGT